MKNKKIIILTIIIAILIFIIIFALYYYKKGKIGNTIINKSEEQIIESILNIKSYDANLEVTIQTNKNTTQYALKQELKEEKCIQEVVKPENIAGIITEYDGNSLKIRNNKLNLETTFQDYKYITENNLWLNSFIKEFKETNNKKTSTTEKEIILEIDNRKNTYSSYKKLYIDKKTGKPTKMQIEDVNQKVLVYILYTEIKIS
mgnify:FL=1